MKINKSFKNLLVILALILIAFAIPSLFLLSKAFQGPCINAENAGQFGAFLGGFLGTSFSFISILLILLSLKFQRESQYVEKFENKFFEMIRLHRENVLEIFIGRDVGKKIFVVLIREYREIVLLIDKLACQNTFILTQEDKYNIAYCVFFYGVGPNSSRILKCALKQYNEDFIEAIIESFELQATRDEVKQRRKLKFTPFEGHQSRLGHYYRHLFQTISYVDNQPEQYLNINQKYNYVKILRAQLTNHEQALLFLNSISVLGSEWRRNGLITKYRLIKNLPEEFFDKEKEIDVKQVYPDLIFEWEEASLNSTN